MAPIDLKGKKVLITGGSAGLGAVIAHKFAAEGAHVAINFNSNEQRAADLASDIEGQYKVKTMIVKADAGNLAECEQCVHRAADHLGGLDIIIGNAGWTRFSNFNDLSEPTEEDWDKCYAVNVKGQMALLRAALPIFNSNAEGGSFIITSSVAGTIAGGSSLPYSVTKAAGLHLMRCLAKTQGPKIRINAVLPGLLLTEWGNKYSPDRINALKEAAVLKDVTDLDDCANAFVMLAKNGSMTGCKIRVDAGVAADWG